MNVLTQITAARGTKITADTHIAQIANEEFDLIVCPGGMPGAKHLQESNELKQLLVRQHDAGKLVTYRASPYQNQLLIILLSPIYNLGSCVDNNFCFFFVCLLRNFKGCTARFARLLLLCCTRMDSQMANRSHVIHPLWTNYPPK
jgi:hypothetical protein